MDERRTVKKVIRYTRGEADRVAVRAHECGRPMACYVREVSLGTSLKARHGRADAELIRVLAGIGNTLAGLAHLAATDSTLPREHFNGVLNELLEVIRRFE